MIDAVEKTKYQCIRLVLYDIKKDYQKCLRILLKENVTGHELSLGRL
jgi:hypothetical protein